ncbi:MAG: hypothetical protein KDA27_26585, partial [Candidatus Eisenbacteria bacterium]|nr:hypothetical protein [Candidatus Eisenbacteria bacterium]
MDPWSFLLSGTVFLGLFLTATTIAGAGHRAPRTWLSALLLSVSVFLLEFLLLESGFYGLPVVFLTYPLTFLMGPSLWLLAPSVLGEEPVTLRDALHGLPVLVGAVNQIPYYYDALTVGARGLAPRLLVPLGGYEMMTLHLMQLGVYVLLAARLLRRRARMQRDVDSGPIVERAQWIARLAAGLATIIVIQLLGTVAMSLTTHIHRHEFVTALTIGAFILFIGWTMSMNPRLLTPVQEPAARYARGPLSDDRIDSYRDRLLEVFARERPYLEPDLTLEGLARMTGIPHRHLSQVLSRGMGTTF